MRKLIVVGVLSALVAALVTTPASASFDHHFSVIEKRVSARGAGPNTFKFRAHLLNPRNRHDRVGRDWSRCAFNPRRAKCRGVVHLNGDIGGLGNIRISGNLTPDDHRVNVVGGTGDFKGVAGKMVLRGTEGRHAAKLHFDLVR